MSTNVAKTAPGRALPSRADLSHPDSVKQRLDAMEKLLEGLGRIPGTNQRFGLDVILDFLPVGGSVVAGVMGAWLAWEARNLGVSKWTVAKMAGNVGIDMLLGAIPVVGIVPDFFFRSNTRNLRLLKRWIERNGAEGSAEDLIVRR